MPLVSVIVLTHNKEKYTRATLESLLATRGARLEVIVVDNGSTDGTRALLDGLAPEFAARGHALRTRLNETNVGCCTARNQGLDMSEGEYCVFLDNDVMATTPDWAARDPEDNANGRSVPRDYGEFEDYVTQVAEHYRGRIRCWELWNTPVGLTQ